MHSHVDLLILGGGCAGLSLASRLAEFGKDAPKVLIIEQRESYTNDRTWCFWDIESLLINHSHVMHGLNLK